MSEFEAFRQLEQNGWADPATAVSYARHFAQAAAQCVPGMVAEARAEPGLMALDVCTGHGVVAKGLVAAGVSVTGLDFSKAMLELARNSVPQARFVQGDAMALPFDDASFDIVTNGFGVPHIPDPQRAFAEAHRVLKPGGRLVYSVWHGGETSVFSVVFQAIAAHGAPGIALAPGPGPHEYADPARARAALCEAGFAPPELRVVDSVWHVDDPGAPMDYFQHGTVRGGAVLRPQPDAALRAIRLAVATGVRALCGENGPWTVPVPAVLVSSTA